MGTAPRRQQRTSSARRLSKPHAALGQAIRSEREAASISQEELGQRSGLHRTYVGGIERGERNPSFTNIMRIADALDVKVSTLMAKAERL